MSNTQYLHLLENELAVLNERIDRRIIAGLGYNSEARRHKRLLGLTREFRKRTLAERLFGERRSYAR